MKERDCSPGNLIVGLFLAVARPRMYLRAPRAHSPAASESRPTSMRFSSASSPAPPPEFILTPPTIAVPAARASDGDPSLPLACFFLRLVIPCVLSKNLFCFVAAPVCVIAIAICAPQKDGKTTDNKNDE
ncbi:hypothetical protein B0H10DRAFT_2228133 [Mycena sp. CBHHK59/15]|nr:hypothetical protein B0H10DRAFT_2228133 [Mycena sp. CBHHK59/15]